MTHKVAVIGLGVMGQRMLGNMAVHSDFEVVSVWDPDGVACVDTKATYPSLNIADSREALVADPLVDVVYIASPPATHRAHALSAMAHGKAVYCEKPLGVDIAESRDLAAQAEKSGCCCIVNFSLASAHAVGLVERKLQDGVLGDVAGVDIRTHFSTWPRDWQMGAAGWLSRRAQGGFTREVLSHWVYLSERLFGSATLKHTAARYPEGDGAETHLHAGLDCGGVPISIAGSVGGVGPDRVEFTVWGSRESCRIYDWNRLRVSDGGDWQEAMTDIDDPREHGYRLQLDNAAAAFSGKAHTMPDFKAALSVQILIEDMLRQR
ncbi:MAG: gfo/Idh/MocA family oxidoreductase [Alphaproteobacteria bacterium]|nr:gfo/Idh/MocA family oxidoreductase [Alphaproteobacteria bacterium]